MLSDKKIDPTSIPSCTTANLLASLNSIFTNHISFSINWELNSYYLVTGQSFKGGFLSSATLNYASPYTDAFSSTYGSPFLIFKIKMANSQMSIEAYRPQLFAGVYSLILQFTLMPLQTISWSSNKYLSLFSCDGNINVRHVSSTNVANKSLEFRLHKTLPSIADLQDTIKYPDLDWALLRWTGFGSTAWWLHQNYVFNFSDGFVKVMGYLKKYYTESHVQYLKFAMLTPDQPTYGFCFVKSKLDSLSFGLPNDTLTTRLTAHGFYGWGIQWVSNGLTSQAGVSYGSPGSGTVNTAYTSTITRSAANQAFGLILTNTVSGLNTTFTISYYSSTIGPLLLYSFTDTIVNMNQFYIHQFAGANPAAKFGGFRACRKQSDLIL